MAIEKTVVHDRIEVVGEYRTIQIREATIITEGDAEIARTFHRYVLDPDSNVSAETTEIKAIADVVWTDGVKAAWDNRDNAT